MLEKCLTEKSLVENSTISRTRELICANELRELKFNEIQSNEAKKCVLKIDNQLHSVGIKEKKNSIKTIDIHIQKIILLANAYSMNNVFAHHNTTY